MTQPVKLFTAKVTDEYGGEYPEAIVAIHRVRENSERTMESLNCIDNYIVKLEIEAIAYQVNYWYSEATRAKGKRSRPFLVEEDGQFSSALTVDLSNPEIEAMLNSDIEAEEKILRIIKLDFKTKNV